MGHCLSLHAAVSIFDFNSLQLGDINGQDDWVFNQPGGDATVEAGGLSDSGGEIGIDRGARRLKLVLPNNDVQAGSLINSFSLPNQGPGTTTYFSYLYQSVDVVAFAQTGFAAGADLRNGSAMVADRNGTSEFPDEFRLWADGSSTAGSFSPGLSTSSTTLIVGRVSFDANGDESFELIRNPISADVRSHLAAHPLFPVNSV